MTKREQLLSNANVSRWYHNLACGSEHTAEIALRRIALLRTKQHNSRKTATIRSEKGISKAYFDLLLDTITKLGRKAPTLMALAKQLFLGFGSTKSSLRIRSELMEQETQV